MPQLKKILVTLPNSLLEDLDTLASQEGVNRSEMIRQAIALYLKEKKKLELREKLKKGYQEMGALNLALSEMYFDMDQEQLNRYEEKLAECE